MFALLCRNFGSVDGPKLFKSVCVAARQQGIEAARFSLNEIRVFVCIAAAIAVAGASNSRRSHDGGTDIGVGLHGSAHLIDFIDRQLTSAFPRKYSVVFLSRHTWFSFFFFVTSARLPSSSDLRTECVLV
jgi:hypothetical protein